MDEEFDLREEGANESFPSETTRLNAGCITHLSKDSILFFRQAFDVVIVRVRKKQYRGQLELILGQTATILLHYLLTEV